MIAYGKDSMYTRFNDVLGSSYKLVQEDDGEYKHAIKFDSSNGLKRKWTFKTLEAAEQTLEWLDQMRGVKFIPSEIKKLDEPK